MKMKIYKTPAPRRSYSASGRRYLVRGAAGILLAAGLSACSLSGRGGYRLNIGRLPPAELQAKIQADAAVLRIINTRMDSLKVFWEGFFTSASPNQTKVLLPEQRVAFKQSWAQFLDLSRVLQQVVSDGEKFYALDGENRMDAYLNAYGAYLLLYSSGLYIIRHTLDQEHYAVLLDEAQPEYGIPAGQYAELKWNVIHINDVSRVQDGYALYKYFAGEYNRLSWTGNRAWLAVHIGEAYEFCNQELLGSGAAFFGKNSLDIIRRHALNMIFPGQKKFARFLGATKVSDRDTGLISRDQCQKLAQQARPGDIFLERKEWYLSNIGLPGFWPHATLYLGSPEELRAWADDPEVKALLRQKDSTVPDFLSYIAKHYPAAFGKYRGGESGHPYRVIEGLSDGMVFTTLEHSAGFSDYLACLRPKLAKKDISQALELAFKYWGREYDFYFDFLSDHTLVCTELVYKCYESAPGKAGLTLDLERIVGRLTLPPNSIAAQFDREYDKNRQMDLVIFLDGQENKHRAVEGSLAAFRKSWERPRWSAP
jgi:hypothetical protein